MEPFAATTPAVPIRGVHLDLKGLPPTPERLLSLLDLCAALRYNAVLVEWEDTFPWTCDPRLRCETAYTPAQVTAFVDRAAELGIEVISLVQCLGHMETPLSLRGSEGLREVAHRSDVLNPLAPGARALVEAMVADVLALTPKAKWLHLGGDEAWSFGTHPDTAAYIAEHGKGALYLHHVGPLLDSLNARGVRPILWHDMMNHWEDAALDALAPRADLCVWGYGGRPDQTRWHHGVQYIERFAAHGIQMWGGTAYKGADGHNSDLPNPATRAENALGWAESAHKYGMVGVFATAWSRYSTQDVQCEPIDGALDLLADVALLLHDAAPPADTSAREALLASAGEAERLAACRQPLADLRQARAHGWTVVQHLRESLVTATQDGRRRGAGVTVRRLKDLRDTVARLDALAAQMHGAFAGLVDELWLDRYLGERIEPLREELGELSPRVRALEPVGYAAELG